MRAPFELPRTSLAPLVALPVVIVALVGIVGSSAERSEGLRRAGNGAVGIEGFAFAPATVEVKPGTTVVWTNLDGAAHSIEDAGTLFEESDDLQEGDEFAFAYEEPGTYPYFCGIHQYMRGEIVVSE